MTGNPETGQDAIPETSELEHTVVMERIMVEWGALKPALLKVSGGATRLPVLENVTRMSGTLIVEVQAADDLYSTMTVTTTMYPCPF